MTLNIQLMTMGSMIVSGIYLGIAFETYRKLTMWWRQYSVFKFICDLAFSLSQTVIIFYVLYQVNDGQLRIYVFLACLLGFSMYVVFLKKIYIWLLNKIFKFISALFYGVYNLINLIIITPIVNIIKFFYKVLKYILNGLVVLLENTLLKVLKKLILYLYSLFSPSWLEKKSQIEKKYSIIKNTLSLKWKRLFKKGGSD